MKNRELNKRDYFQDDEEKRIVKIENIINGSNNLSDIFVKLTKHLGKQFHINKGVLVLKRGSSNNLAAVSTWNNGHAQDGLAIDLPGDSSLFEKVVEHGQVYTEDFCGSFSGNFFERKLLLDNSSRSFVLHPLKSEGEVIGLLGYSSEKPTAFAVFEEGILDDVAGKFADAIYDNLHREY